MKNKQIRIHPNEKPVELYRWILKKFGKPGFKILDTHGGSLSLGLACLDLDFELDIYENDKYYFDLGVFRLKKHYKKKKLKLFNTSKYYEALKAFA
ncbi:unnamed protein product [marine sediment metagenome]|uniref:DNA methylase N-4/N-6 domain-containing protein n=1 Tax=marine sediment metagenome TaxID=412755 RepID=X1CJL1_9ZZZZ